MAGGGANSKLGSYMLLMIVRGRKVVNFVPCQASKINFLPVGVPHTKDLQHGSKPSYPLLVD